MAAVASTDFRPIGIVFTVLIINAVVLYFTMLRPLRNRSPEEAIRHVRDHGWKKYRNDDLITFSRRSITRMDKKHRRPILIFFTAINAIWIVLAIFIVALGKTKFLFGYFALGLMLISISAFGWFFDYIIRTQIAVFKRYLDEAD